MSANMRFKHQKAVEAILFIASKLPSLTRHTLAKLFYFADKAHLQEYGRLISADRYIAMKHGPVPSRVYDMIKCPELYECSKGAFDTSTHPFVRALREPNMDYLSQSEVECIEGAIKRYGQLSFAKLTDLSHDAAWDKADQNDEIALEDIALTVKGSDELLAYLNDPFPEESEKCLGTTANI